jgi:hypothetical protein
MKLLAVAIAALFACGIVAGLHPPFATQTGSHVFVLGGLAAVACLIFAGLLLTRLLGGPQRGDRWSTVAAGSRRHADRWQSHQFTWTIEVVRIDRNSRGKREIVMNSKHSNRE